MIAFGYEAMGLASDDVFVCTLDKTGQVKREVRIKQPYVSIIHDMAVTQKHIVLPFGGYVTSLERLKAGKIHWGWDQTKPSMIGVLPARRRGEGRALVQGSRALHDAHVQRAHGRQQSHPVRAVLGFEFLSVLPASGWLAVES